MSEPQPIELRAGDLTLRVSPEIGGAITAFEREAGGRSAPLLLGLPEKQLTPALADRAACFPMLPFANRAPGNVLRVGDTQYPIKPNTAEPNALHGCAWQRPWWVVRREQQRLELGLEVAPASYAFAFSARQIFSLRAQGLTVTLSLTNTHSQPIPAGLGLHPYFPRGATTKMRFAADRFWLEGPGYLPTESIETPPELDFAEPGSLPVHWRNNCYSGWQGKAEITQPDLGYRLTMTASTLLTDLMLFTPLASPVFALEPQSHTVAATDTTRLVAHAQPLALLQPGESIEASVEFGVSDLHPV